MLTLNKCVYTAGFRVKNNRMILHAFLINKDMMLACTFGSQPTERPQQLRETQIVFACHCLGVVAAQHGHHGHERVLDELLHRLSTPSHGGTRAWSASSALNRNKATALEFKNNSPTDIPPQQPCCILTVSRLLINVTPIVHRGCQATAEDGPRPKYITVKNTEFHIERRKGY